MKQGIRQLLPHSKEVGVPIALEPLHPMTAADRSCLCTLRQALDWCDELDPDGEFGLGVAVDVYHVWWDPDPPVRSCVPENASSRFMFPTGWCRPPIWSMTVECREMVSSIFRQFVGWLKTPDLMALLNWKYSHRTGGRKILTARWILASIASHIIVKEMIMNDQPVLFSRAAAFRRLTLNREDKCHAINEEMIESLDHYLNEIENDTTLRLVELTATGDKFLCGRRY